ncbi:MAG: hypothetical protein UH241_04660 [Acutalibacteraceae bacterium]|nr:hypothetical protein [Acutalibacteraceae bacterium]
MNELIKQYIKKHRLTIAIYIFLIVICFSLCFKYQEQLNINRQLSDELSAKNQKNSSDVVNDNDYNAKLEIEVLIRNYADVYYECDNNTKLKYKENQYKQLVTENWFELSRSEFDLMFFIPEKTVISIDNIDVYCGKIYSTKATAVSVIEVKTENRSGYTKTKIYEKYQLVKEKGEWLIDKVET